MAIAPGTIQKNSIAPENYRYLQQFLREQTGIVVEEDKHYFFESRLGPAMQKHDFASVDVLCSFLRVAGRGELRRDCRDAMTTNETLFFRDQHPFDALRDVIIPEIVSSGSTSRRLRIWSAAAASGQESYSLVMLFLEMHLPGWEIEVIGTDISESVLQRAREGRYMRLETNRGLPAALLLKYFEPAGMQWQVKEEVRKRVQFVQFDLRTSMSSLGTFDVIFCRNVLIYFDTATKTQIIRALRGCMRNHAHLTLGSAEAIMDPDLGLTRRAIGGALFYQLGKAGQEGSCKR